jgi:uncharacterized membrane protein
VNFRSTPARIDPTGVSRQRGAVAVLAAIATLAGLVAIALAIDLGRLYFVQRDLQRMANMAALDAARVAGGCLGVPANPSEAAFSEAVNSVSRNGGLASYVPPDGVAVGRMLHSSGLRLFDAQQTDPKNRAVQVSLARPAPLQLLPLFTSDALRTLHATAAAYSRPSATVKVGSKLLEVSPELLNNLLGPMLGGPVSLDAVTYRNLLGADVPIAAILENLDIGTPTEPSLAPSVPAGDFFDALSAALAQQGNAVAAAGAAALAQATADDRVVRIGDLIGIDPAADTSSAVVSVGALVESASQLANGNNLINLVVPRPGGGGAQPDPVADLRVIEAARQAILTPGDAAGAYARNAQVLLQLALPISIGGNGGNLRLFAQTAQATAQVDEILCGRRGSENDQVTVGARSSIVRIGIGAFDDINAPDPQPQPAELARLDLNVLGMNVRGIRITGFAIADVGDPHNERLPVYVGPFPAEGITHRLGTPPATAMVSGLTDLASNLQLKIELPGGLPPLVASAVLAQLQPLLDNLRPMLIDVLANRGGDLLQELSAALDTDLGGADVTVLKVVAEEPFLFNR